jgi:hypothetical protein
MRKKASEEAASPRARRKLLVNISKALKKQLEVARVRCWWTD